MAEARHVLTNKGSAYMAKIGTGMAPEFTRVTAGSGSVDEDQLVEQTAVSGPICDMSTDERRIIDNITLVVPARLTSSHVATSVLIRQIGVYAQDPDEGEILYQLVQFKNPQPLASLEANHGIEDVFEHDLYVVVANADDAMFPADPSYQVSRQEFNEHKEDAQAHSGAFASHNADSAAHPDLRQMVGDGSAAAVSAHNANTSAHADIRTAVGSKADQSTLNTHTGNQTVHITAAERSKWDTGANTASAAQTTANTAKSTAENAQSAAGTAQGTANSAQTTANNALARSGGTMTGNLISNNPAVGTSAVRNIYAGTGTISSLTEGTIYLQYE